jgi:hypothetical protein
MPVLNAASYRVRLLPGCVSSDPMTVIHARTAKATTLLAPRGAKVPYRNNITPVAAPANIVITAATLVLNRGLSPPASDVRGERYPVLAVNGDYGVQGPTFDHSHGAFSFQAGLNVPIFTSGRIEGDLTQAEAALRQRRAEAENLRGQIDYDVRTAFLNLQAAKEQVAVARQNVDLANENLSRSKERFAAGVTDSVEVVQAQQSLASANDQYISSLYSHNLAKLQLARALGVARTSYNQYLAGR